MMDNDIVQRNCRFHTKKNILSISKNIFFMFIVFNIISSFPSHAAVPSIPSNNNLQHDISIQTSDSRSDQIHDNGADNDPSYAGTKPTACFSWNPTPLLAGEIVTFDASCSVDPDGGSIPQDGVPAEHDDPMGGNGITPLCSCAGSDKTNRFADTNQIGLYSGPNDENGNHFTEEEISDEFISKEVELFSSYFWDFGDGTSSTEKNPAHIYNIANDYQVSLTVVDNEGKTDTITQGVYVASSPFLLAVIDEIYPNPGVKGEPVSFTGYGEDPMGYSITGYSWRSSIDGNFITEQSFTTAGLSAGTHIISFKVKNCSGWSTEVQTTLLIDISPIADMGKGSNFGWIKEPILFDGSGSTDPDGTIIAYKWNFGDGTFTKGKITNHIYSHIGTYTVTLTVTDNNGASNTATTIAKIVCDPPIANAGGPYYGYVNHPVFFNGSNSSDNDGSITNYVWNFGDGTIGTGQTPLHIYQKNGTYIVTLTVTDADGETDTDTTTANITANLPPKKPEFQGTPSGYINHEYTYIAVSTDPNHDNISYQFYWGDNTNTTTPFFPNGTLVTEMHTWISTGTYTIHVYATDENNATSEPTEFLVLMKNDTSTNSHDGQTLENEFSGQTSTITRSVNEQETKTQSYVIMGAIFLPIVVVAAMIFLYTKKRF